MATKHPDLHLGSSGSKNTGYIAVDLGLRHRYSDSYIYRFWKDQEANRLAGERLSDTAAKLTHDAMSLGAFV